MRAILAVLAASAIAAPASARDPATPPQRAVPASALLLRAKSRVLDFRWRVAPEAANQPALLAQMRAAAIMSLTRHRRDAASDAAGAKGHYPFHRHLLHQDWALASDTPRLLALVGQTQVYTGGAHDNFGLAAILWDKRTGRRLVLASIFKDWPRALAILEPGYCAALAAERQRRIGDPAPKSKFFEACPKLADQPMTIWGGLDSAAGEFRVLIAPYVAGSFAEGSYIITLRWPDAVRPLVRPEYHRDLFGGD